jgi:hypothetical protein
MGHSGGESNPGGESTGRRRRGRVDEEAEEGEEEKGRRIEQSRLQLCSFLYFLSYIACIYVQTQGKLALPWENILILLESLCDEVQNEALNLYLKPLTHAYLPVAIGIGVNLLYLL